MLQEIQSRIVAQHNMIDAIRIRQRGDITVELLKDALAISRAAADKAFGILKETLPQQGSKDSPKEKILICPSDRKVHINSNSAYFLGISIGSTHVRVVLLGLDFQAIKRETLEKEMGFSELREAGAFESHESDEYSYSFKTPTGKDAFQNIRALVVSVIKPMLNLHKKDAQQRGTERAPFRLMGIGFAVAGPVDYQEKIWLSARRILSVKEVTLQDLMGYDNFHEALENNIFLSIDNNAKAAVVSEYQYLMEKNCGQYNEDIAVLYVGTGIGSAAVIGRKLQRGNRNLFGEVGQLRVYNETDADLGLSNNLIEDCINKKSALEKGDYNNYYTYVPRILNAITCVTGINRIIIIGHSIAKNAELIPKLMDQRFSYTLTYTQNSCEVEKGRGQPYTAAIGAAIEAYFSMCNFDFSCDGSVNKVNLATDIQW